MASVWQVSGENSDRMLDHNRWAVYKPQSVVSSIFRGLVMANHKSAKKRIRRNANRAEINKSRISRIRTFIKKVEMAITSGDKESAQVALKEAQPEIMRGVSKGVIHKNTASRKVSRLSARVKAVGA